MIFCSLPQTARAREEKEEFYIVLGNVLKSIDENKKLVVCRDLNRHLGAATDGIDGVHSGKVFGIRNK